MLGVQIPEWLIGFLISLPFSSLVEYWGHRAMHSWLLRKRHANHHRENSHQGWLGEFRDYLVGGFPFLFCGFFYSVEAGIGYFAGSLLYCAWVAYNHQLQHECPEMTIWLRRPVHYLHHRDKMWKHNFGISTGVWDVVFGTYKPAEWQPEAASSNRGLRRLLTIKWL